MALSLSEQTSLEYLVRDRELSDGLKAWLQIQEDRYTKLCRDQQNLVPEDLHAEMKKKTLCAQYAAKASVFATMWKELQEQFGAKRKQEEEG